jgi:predicted AAA+ superfamily ATPase
VSTLTRTPADFCSQTDQDTQAALSRFGFVGGVARYFAGAIAADRMSFGALLETFVFSELLKLASWSDNRFQFFHFRDKDKNEVDIVIEDLQGRVVGIKVKATGTASAKDFGGLTKLAPVSALWGGKA